jgi:hypothetical protein
MADNLGANIRGQYDGDCYYQCDMCYSVVGVGWWDAVRHAKGGTVVSGYDDEVHLVPERRHRRVAVLPSNDSLGMVQMQYQRCLWLPLLGIPGREGKEKGEGDTWTAGLGYLTGSLLVLWYFIVLILSH